MPISTQDWLNDLQPDDPIIEAHRVNLKYKQLVSGISEINKALSAAERFDRYQAFKRFIFENALTDIKLEPKSLDTSLITQIDTLSDTKDKAELLQKSLSQCQQLRSQKIRDWESELAQALKQESWSTWLPYQAKRFSTWTYQHSLDPTVTRIQWILQALKDNFEFTERTLVMGSACLETTTKLVSFITQSETQSQKFKALVQTLFSEKGFHELAQISSIALGAIICYSYGLMGIIQLLMLHLLTQQTLTWCTAKKIDFEKATASPIRMSADTAPSALTLFCCFHLTWAFTLACHAQDHYLFGHALMNTAFCLAIPQFTKPLLSASLPSLDHALRSLSGAPNTGSQEMNTSPPSAAEKISPETLAHLNYFLTLLILELAPISGLYDRLANPIISHFKLRTQLVNVVTKNLAALSLNTTLGDPTIQWEWSLTEGSIRLPLQAPTRSYALACTFLGDLNEVILNCGPEINSTPYLT